jgi:carboxyl-terminal processing protease
VDGSQAVIAALLASHYVRAVDADELSGVPADQLAVVLGDVNTRVVAESALPRITAATRRASSGVGMSVREVGGAVEIDRVLPKSPAAAAGMRSGDVVMTVDGEPVSGASAEQVLAMVRGGQRFTRLTIRRAEAASTVTVNQTASRDWLVTAELRASGSHHVGYIALLDLDDAVSDQVRAGVRTLLDQGAEAVVLDLRGAVGHLESEAVQVAEVFLPPTSPVLVERGAHIQTSTMTTGRAPEDVRVPLALLVDGQTAGSAELLAGALRDNGRAQLVGEKTFGQGTKQDAVRLQDGAALMFTSAEYLTPNGLTFDRVGLSPDVVSPTQQDHDQDPAFEMSLAMLLPEAVRLEAETG